MTRKGFLCCYYCIYFMTFALLWMILHLLPHVMFFGSCVGNLSPKAVGRTCEGVVSIRSCQWQWGTSLGSGVVACSSWGSHTAWAFHCGHRSDVLHFCNLFSVGGWRIAVKGAGQVLWDGSTQEKNSEVYGSGYLEILAQLESK